MLTLDAVKEVNKNLDKIIKITHKKLWLIN